MDLLFGKPAQVHTGSSLSERQQEVADLLRSVLLKTLGGSVPFSDEASINRFIESAVEQPLRRQLSETILPQIKSSYAGAGTYWGGERARAETRAAEDTAREIAARAAEARLNLGQQGYSNLLQAMNAATDYLSVPMMYSFLAQPTSGAFSSLVRLIGAFLRAGG